MFPLIAILSFAAAGLLAVVTPRPVTSEDIELEISELELSLKYHEKHGKYEDCAQIRDRIAKLRDHLKP